MVRSQRLGGARPAGPPGENGAFATACRRAPCGSPLRERRWRNRMDWRPISADSHITEPPGCYVDNIDPAFRERAPHIVSKDGIGDTYIVEGMKTPVPLGLVAAAGIAPKDLRMGGAKFEDLHRGGWD